MPLISRFIVLAAATLVLGACVSGAVPTDPGSPATHYVVLEGRVVSLSNAGVPFARVGVHIPANRSPLSYLINDAQTGFNGDYQLAIFRMLDVGQLPPVDTMSVWVLAVQNARDGGRTDSAQVLLRFHPAGEQSVPQQLNVQLGIP
jgi:hypothetical protein